jgi:hypothetical protein
MIEKPPIESLPPQFFSLLKISVLILTVKTLIDWLVLDLQDESESEIIARTRLIKE